MVRLSPFSFIVLVLFLLANVQLTWGQTIRAYVDRNPISMDETVRLVVEQQGPSTGDSPDQSVLEKDFDVLGTSQSSQTSIINGQTSTSNQWIITLAPKRTGKVTIPPIQVGGQASKPLVLKVRQQPQVGQATAGKDIFLEAMVEPKDPYVQSSIVYTLRLFHAVPLREGQMNDPKISQAVVERIGEDRSFETIRDGRRYQVIERRYLVVPQASGRLTIPSVLFSGQVPDGRGPRSLFDDMFGNRPGVFGGSFQSTRLVRARSPEMTLKIQEIPSDMNSGVWLPARELSLTETWSTDLAEIQIGDPITRTITIQAKGATGEQLPELPLSENRHVKIYPDQPIITTTFDGLWAVGTREQKLALVPTQPGHVTIPEIRIQWWNLENHQTEEAILPARSFTIAGASSPPVTSPSPLDKGNLALSDGTSSYSTKMGDATPQENRDHWLPSSPLTQWPLMASLFLVMWILTIAGWWYDRRTLRAHQKSLNTHEEEQTRRSLRAVRDSVKKACLENSPNQTREALLKWASVTGDDIPYRNLGSVAKKFSSQEQSRSEAQQAIWDLDRNLYAPQGQQWDGRKFWEIVDPEMKNLEKTKGTGLSQQANGLAPLYLSSRS